MDKDDVYFLIGTVLTILGLLGTDWGLVRERVHILFHRVDGPRSHTSVRGILVLLALTVAMSSL
jgi:hypothetical protein